MVMGGKATSARVTAYLAQEAAKVLEEWAKSENRTVSNLAATILLNAIETRQASHENATKDKGAA
jgi:hypothetical protein